MHQEIKVEFGHKNVLVDAKTLKVECQISPRETLPQSYLSAVRLGQEKSAVLEFENGETMRAWCDEEVWVALIRAGMVPSHAPEFAETLQTCIEARKKLEAAIAQAQAEYEAVVAPLTQVESVGSYEDEHEFRQIPGFGIMSFPCLIEY